jgi:ADP-ribose diphosphatase
VTADDEPAQRSATPGDPADDPLRERVVESRLIHRGRVTEFRTETIERVDGSRGTRDIVVHPGAIAVVAIDDRDRLLLVRQWRVPAGGALLEIPAGTLDIHDGVTEDADVAARRELEEETGHRASAWRKLSTFWTAPGFATELMHLYLATGLHGVEGDERLAPDEDEHLELIRVPLDEALRMVDAGEICDAKSIIGIQWLERERRRPASVEAGTPTRVRYGFTPAQYALANARWMRSVRGVRLLGVALLVLGLLTVAIGSDAGVYLPPLLLGIAIVSGLFALPFAIWGARGRREVIADAELGFDDGGLHSSWIVGASDIRWTGIDRISRSGPLLFIRIAGSSTMMIPIAAFTADELERFRRLALRHGLTLDGHRVDPALG